MNFFIVARHVTFEDPLELIIVPVQDVIFGSEGTAQADFERQEEINVEIGLTQMLRGSAHGGGSDIDHIEKEKVDEHTEKVD